MIEKGPFFQIDVDSDAIDRLQEAILSSDGKRSFETQLKISIGSIMKRTGQAMRTEAWRAVKEEYTVKQKGFYQNTRVKSVKQPGGGAGFDWGNSVAEIEFAGHKIPLSKFDISPKSPKRQIVSVSVLKNSGNKTLNHAYVADLGRHGIGLFEGVSNRRQSRSKQLYGPSGAEMMSNERTEDNVTEAAIKTIDKRVEHEITRILNGWGI